ncbi:MFS transporter [Anaerobiospirillum sp. NML120449]|uniref:MFS transporter n=1 Tax=Anaerobiospirillum sp. NML120449 TaxID=2932817 RepID=UPI001FF5A577|nr:MFS transporter [Anaerobiospirillum sp. NML120449]MCK0526074.1 MFS transporter [Anaerobiospirillum sp. NML120449]
MRKSSLVVCCVSLCLFLTSYTGNALTVAVPFLVKHFNTLPQYASLALTGYATALACFLLPASLLARRFSNRRIFLTGLISCAAITAAIPFSPNLWVMVAARIAQGAAASLCVSTAMALISSHVETSRRFIAIGIAVCLTYTGVSSSLSFSGVIIDGIGYQYMFYGAAIAMAALIFLAVRIPQESADSTVKLPYSRIVVFAFSIGLCLLSLSCLASWHYARYGLILGLALTAALVIYEYSLLTRSSGNKDISGRAHSIISRDLLRRALRLGRRQHAFESEAVRTGLNSGAALAPLNSGSALSAGRALQVIPVQLLIGNRPFTWCFLVSIAAYVSVMAEPVLLALFSQYTLGISASQAGFIIVVQPVTIAVVSFFTGRIARILGGNLTVTVGLIIQTIALATFTIIDESTTVTSLILRQLAVGTGFALFSAPNTTIITLTVSRQNYALASSMQQLGRSIGQGTAYALVTVIIAAVVSAKPGSASFPEQFADASVIILSISALLGIGGIFFAALGTIEDRRQARTAAADHSTSSTTSGVAGGTSANAAANAASAAATVSVNSTAAEATTDTEADAANAHSASSSFNFEAGRNAVAATAAVAGSST